MPDRLTRVKAAFADRYAIERELGSGGSATVYLAEDLKHKRKIAVKVLRPELAAVLGAERFLREIEIAARLTHPHILPLHDSGQAGEFLYYVMPYVEGESLRDRLRREGQLPLADAVEIAREVAGALDYAHSVGLVHRDIKPENILLSGGHAIIADFGIARAITRVSSEQVTGAGLAVGTPAYMSPEQAGGEEQVDGRSDLYSLGCVLYEMLGGEPPYSGSTPRAVLAKKLAEPVPRVRVLRETVPEELERVTLKALAKAPADRFATAAQFAAALEATTDVGKAGVASRRRSVRVVAAGALVLAVAGGWWVTNRTGAGPRGFDPNRVVVFPLAERGTAAATPGVGYDVALMIEIALERAHPLKWIDGWDRLEPHVRHSPSELTARVARRIAQSQRARFYLTGLVLGSADSLGVTLRLWDAAADSLVVQHSTRGDRHEAALHQLGVGAVIGVLPFLTGPGGRVDLTDLRERDASAVALWIQGERRYRSGKFDSSLTFYRRSLAVDSGLVYSAFKAAQAADWTGEKVEARDLIRHALAHDSLLSPKHRDYARALEAYLAGRGAEATEWIGRTLAADPEWVEALTLAGEVFHHLVPRVGNLDSIARDRFTAARRLDPDFLPPVGHLAEIDLRDGNAEGASRYLQEWWLGGADSSHLRHVELMLRCVQVGTTLFDWDHASRDDPGALLNGAKLLAGTRFDDCAEGALRALYAAHPPTTAYGLGAFLTLQGLLLAQGRHVEAGALIDSATAAGATRTGSLYILAAAAGAPFIDRAERTVRAAQRAFGRQYRRAPGPQSLWLLGVWHAVQREQDALQTTYDALAARASDANPQTGVFARAIGAHVALARGDTVNALEQLQRLTPSADLASLTWEFGYALPVEYLTLAQLLLARSRYREAIEAAAVLDHPTPVMYLSFLPASLVIRFEAARALGARRLADVYRERLARLGRADLLDGMK